MHEGRRHAATTRIAATVPWTGTHVIASYQVDRRPSLGHAGECLQHPAICAHCPA